MSAYLKMDCLKSAGVKGVSAITLAIFAWKRLWRGGKSTMTYLNTANVATLSSTLICRKLSAIVEFFECIVEGRLLEKVKNLKEKHSVVCSECILGKPFARRWK